MGDAESNLVDVTGADYAIMTIRGVPYSNFDNFVTVYYEITPKDLSTEGINVIGFNSHLDSADEAQEITVKYTNDYGWEEATLLDDKGNVKKTNPYGKQVRQTLTLEEGKDYDVSTVETSTPGVYEMTITGKGNYTGSITKTYAVGDSQTPGLTFPDVDYSAWYAAGVTFCADKGLITGYAEGADAGKFGVGRTMTRAEFAVILWRYSCPDEQAAYDEATMAATKNETGISDVQDGQWYTAAANWAVKNGVISGKQLDGTRYFDPYGVVDFEQMIAIMGNLCANGADETADQGVLNAFTDGAEVETWARGSIAWGKQAGLVNGYENEDGTRSLRPHESVLRERAAVVVMNAFDAGALCAEDELVEDEAAGTDGAEEASVETKVATADGAKVAAAGGSLE